MHDTFVLDMCWWQHLCWHICEECRFRGCHSSVTELSVLLSCNTVLLGYRLSLFEKQYICFDTLWTGNMMTQCSVWKTWILIYKEISTTDITLVDFFLGLGSVWIVRGCLITEFSFFLKRKHVLFEDWK